MADTKGYTITTGSSDGTRILIGKKTFQYIPKTYTAADAARIEKQKATIEDLAKEKNPGISFDLLPPEAKEIAKDKLTAFENIIKPGFNQKQENDIKTRFDSEEQEFKFWYDQVLPSITGVPSSAESK